MVSLSLARRCVHGKSEQYTTTNYTRVVTDERPLSTVTIRSTKHREQPLLSNSSIGQYVVASYCCQTFPNLSSQIGMYQGRIDSCDVTFPSANGRACNTRFKFIIWPCLFTVRPTLSPIDLCRSM